jgi:hypothetical protein
MRRALASIGLLGALGAAALGCKTKSAPKSVGPAVLEGAPGPEAVDGHRVRSLSAAGDHFCALYMNGTVACWGATARPALGLSGDPDVPVRVPDIRGATELALGDCHGCALGPDGKVACWGYRVPPSPERHDADTGEVAEAALDLRSCTDAVPLFAARPVLVRDLPKMRLLSASADSAFTCGVSASEQLECWGAWSAPGSAQVTMTHQALGGGGAGSGGAGGGDDATPSLAGAVELAYGAFPCARFTDGRARCWPRTKGAPAVTAPPAPVVSVAGAWGLDERCFALASGAVQCRAGDGVVDIPGEHAAKSVAMAVPEVCATHADGAIACFTYDARPGSATATPLVRTLRAKVRSLAAGRDTLCALLDDDGVQCWRAGTLIVGAGVGASSRVIALPR